MDAVVIAHVCFAFRCLLISVKPLITENTENKTTPKISKITVKHDERNLVARTLWVVKKKEKKKKKRPTCASLNLSHQFTELIGNTSVFGKILFHNKVITFSLFFKRSLNGVYSSLFRAKASGGHSKAREPRDPQFLQQVTRFALIGVGPAWPRVCKCPPPQIPVSQSPF